MANLEMVEKLRERANVTYDEAKEALEACGDDLLEAMIHLEKQGKVQPPSGQGTYSTKDAPGFQGQGKAQEAPAYDYHIHADGFGHTMRRLGKWIVELIHKGNTNFFEIHRKETLVITLPVTVLVLLTLFCFWVVLPALVVGLFIGCKYRFRGRELENTPVNSVMETASMAADDLKNEVETFVAKKKNNNGENDQQSE